MILNGEVRIGFVNSNGPDGDYMEVDIADITSGIHFARAKVSMKDVPTFFRQMYTQCEIETRGLDYLGTRKETKTEFVPDQAGDRLGPFEVDGWRGDASALRNHHKYSNRDGVKGHTVTFHRFVRPDGTPVT